MRDEDLAVIWPFIRGLPERLAAMDADMMAVRALVVGLLAASEVDLALVQEKTAEFAGSSSPENLLPRIDQVMELCLQYAAVRRSVP